MSPMNSATPVGFLILLVGVRLDRARRDERGVSAVEWVVIAAILVGVCGVIAFILTNALRNEATRIGGEIEGG